MLNPITSFEQKEDGSVSAERRSLLYRMRYDKLTYAVDKPPCQLLPFVLSTSGVGLLVRTEGGALVPTNVSSIKALMESGCYFWVEHSVEAKPAHCPGVPKPGFELGAAMHIRFYQPPQQCRRAYSVDSMPWDLPYVRWRRERVKIWVPNQDSEA